ncbi:MAG: hypothetical protein ING19_02775 [Azospirillum sp.]|nr:hypothetical protein [Azospirillum sp.]
MNARRPKSEYKIATLADLIAAGARTARVYCVCGRSETANLMSMRAGVPDVMPWVEIRTRMVCKGCGAKGQVTTTIEYPFAVKGQVSHHGGLS